jgi:hypothetical protein
MSKREFNLAVADLQKRVDRIANTRDQAQKTATAAVDRKYRKQLMELLTSTVESDQGPVPLFNKEVVDAVELPEFSVEQVADDQVEDVLDDGYALPDEQGFDASKIEIGTITA